jgi:SAM-dependent methyltransferase
MGMPKEVFAHDTLTGKVSIEARAKRQIKGEDGPRIVVCVPIGPKKQAAVFDTPDGNRLMAHATHVPGCVPIQWVLHQMNLVTPLNSTISYLAQWGMLSGEARQILTMRALEIVQDDGYILYWDDDMLAPPLSLYTMYSYMEQHPEVGLVSAVYCTRNDPVEPVIYGARHEGAMWNLAVGPNAEPQEIYSAGSGFMLVRAKAVLDIVKKNPDVPVWADVKSVPIEGDSGSYQLTEMWGHDIRFCRLLGDAGWKLAVDGRVEVPHFDIYSQKAHVLPDNSAPKVRGRNINTRSYWDEVYTREGAQTWRQYPEMFERVGENVSKGQSVAEIGCGVGILGSRLTASLGVSYKGFDLSETAVEMAKTRFLDCVRKSVSDLTAADLGTPDVVVATELVEHLSKPDLDHLLKLVADSTAKFVFTVPDNCMGPKDVPEHQALFNEELVQEIVKKAGFFDAWSLKIEKADAQHLICVLQPEKIKPRKRRTQKVS